MPAIRLTKRSIDAIESPASGQILYRDSDLIGFGLRVGTKTKVFYAEAQVKRRTIRVTIGKYGTTTPEVARKRAMEILSEMANGNDPRSEEITGADLTVKGAFDEFFNRRPLAKSSQFNYERTVRVYLKDWADKPIIEISRRMVLDRHKWLSDKNGAYTANTVMRHLRSVYNFTAAAYDDIPPNPVSILTQARAWNKERRRRSVIPVHGLPDWWQAVHEEDDSVRDFLIVALLTGMRRSEIARLRWDCIDLDGRILTVPRTKNGDPLQLPLSTYLYELLLSRRDQMPDEEWVFPGDGVTGHLVETKRFYNRVKERCGIAFTLHDLRRTFVTVAESMDVPHYALKRLLNHRSDGDVTGGYIIMDVERLRKPVEKVAQQILELVGGR
ncbi:tyrosine-type recombinase/integrase [Asticcacaulis taihuensis]|uniref:Site-specific recombinase XerD n=1 Tax=Asticcacaulis taihuensis TaxID=260084 RepID=A0A1G4SVV9_9CAUL|nr:integrase family protein [Asticcacaulis taihuensis]SCW73354.1 Site-specific recombinase XerD [Asticcacaulis taihuensis]